MYCWHSEHQDGSYHFLAIPRHGDKRNIRGTRSEYSQPPFVPTLAECLRVVVRGWGFILDLECNMACWKHICMARSACHQALQAPLEDVQEQGVHWRLMPLEMFALWASASSSDTFCSSYNKTKTIYLWCIET